MKEKLQAALKAAMPGLKIALVAFLSAILGMKNPELIQHLLSFLPF